MFLRRTGCSLPAVCCGILTCREEREPWLNVVYVLLRAEHIREGARIAFREGRTKACGMVLNLIPWDQELLPGAVIGTALGLLLPSRAAHYVAECVMRLTGIYASPVVGHPRAGQRLEPSHLSLFHEVGVQATYVFH